METPDHDEVVRRLRSLGSEPVEPGVAGRHLSFLAAAAAPEAARTRRRPLMVGAMLAGLVLGGTGLAAALPGSLPQQAGAVARDALEAVNLVDGKKNAAQSAKKAAQAAAKAAATQSNLKVGRFLEGCFTGTPPVPFTGNHGQYVKAHPDDPATADVNEREVAAQSDCGKPLSSLGADDAAEDATEAEKADKVKAEKAEKAKADKADDADDAADATEGAGKPADTGRPESPGKSEDTHPPTTAVNEQGSDNKATDTGNAGDAGKADERRPEGVGTATTAG